MSELKPEFTNSEKYAAFEHVRRLGLAGDKLLQVAAIKWEDATRRASTAEEQLTVALDALVYIANADYRGNRSHESCTADEALTKIRAMKGHQ